MVESRGVGREIGIAALDRNSGRCALTQLQDVQSYWRTTHSLHQRRPSTVVVQQSALTAKAGIEQVSGEPTPLVRSIQSAFETVPVVGIKRQYWSDAIGYEFIQQLIVADEGKQATLVSVEKKCASRYGLG